MLKKSLLAISLLLPLAALSATAHAGATITDRSYLPNEARGSVQSAASSQGGVNAAFAYDRGGSIAAPATIAIGDRSPWQYHGGPKSR